MQNSFEVRNLTPTIGGEVVGLDLTRDMSDDAFAELREAFLDRQVLFFRDQPMSIDQHKALGRRFGELHIHPAAQPYRDGETEHPEVLRIHADEKTSRTAGDSWHSDVSCDAEPPMASILKLHKLPPSGGDTLFASMYAAYDALSAPMKAFLGGLSATHDGGPNYRDRARRKEYQWSDRTYPQNSHPVIRTHPETGRKAIYVNAAFTSHIDDVPKAESDAILNFLYQHNANPAFQCRFQWTENAVAMWDNRCTLHHAMWDYYPHVRSGLRVTVKGDRPF